MTTTSSPDGATELACPPVATVGIIGDGQVARMTHQAAMALGIDVRTLSPRATGPAVRARATHPHVDHQELESLLALAQGCDVITLGHEHTATDLLDALVDAGHCLRPTPAAARFASDNDHARRALTAAGFPIPAFAEIPRGDLAAVDAFARDHGWPLVLQGSADGCGIEVLADLPAFRVSALAATQPRWLVEAAVPTATELTVLVARRPAGWSKTYPVAETLRRDGIRREVVMPARVPAGVAEAAGRIAVSIADGIDAAGILAVELFLTPGGDLVVNEVAARPHANGYATIDAAVTSQFENHLRGVLDWPLGDTTLVAPVAATVNLLGPAHPIQLQRNVPAALEDPTVRIHLYRKDPRPGRVIGHVTCLDADHDSALAAARRAAATLTAQ